MQHKLSKRLCYH